MKSKKSNVGPGEAPRREFTSLKRNCDWPWSYGGASSEVFLEAVSHAS